MAQDLNRYLYRIDAQDTVLFVASDWPELSLHSAAPRLTRHPVIGVPLWEFVADDKIEHLYSLLFRQAREERKMLLFAFCRDWPTLRSMMELKITPLPDNHLEIEGCLLGREKELDQAALDEAEGPLPPWLAVCSWCRKARVAGDQWLDVDRAVRVLDLLSALDLPGITHGICGDCLARVEARWKSRLNSA